MQPASKEVQHSLPAVNRIGNVYYLQYRPHKQEVKHCRWVWKPLNAVQRWLEGEDKLSIKVIAYGVLGVTVVFMVAQVVRVYG